MNLVNLMKMNKSICDTITMVNVQVYQLVVLLAITSLANVGNAVIFPELIENCKKNCDTPEDNPRLKALPLYCAVLFGDQLGCRNGTAEISNLVTVIDALSKVDMGAVLNTFTQKYIRSASELHLRQDNSLDLEETNNPTGNIVEHGRHKRDVIMADSTFTVQRRGTRTPNHGSEGTFVINGVSRTSPQYYDSQKAIDINCLQAADKSFLVSIEDVGSQRLLMMNELEEMNLDQRLLFNTSAPEAISVEVFKIKEDLFAFTTVRHDPQELLSTSAINTGSTLYRVNLANHTFDKTQTIHMPFAQSSAFWKGMGEEANDIFLVIAPSKALIEREVDGVKEAISTFEVMVPCYRWQGGYFDYVSQLPASNPLAINHFEMFSHDYLAVANYQDDTGSTSIQSEIFKYQHNEARFLSFQKIQTHGAKDIRHFSFESSDGRLTEHFIAIANNCKKDQDGKEEFWVQSTIMKYGDLRFMPFKSIYAYGALQFLPVKDGEKFFLALADLHGIRMFQYNGWTFVQTHSMQYETNKLSPFSINMRQLCFHNPSFVGMLVASNSPGVKNGIFAVNFETRNDHRKLLTSVEGWCDSATEQIQSRDLAEMENKLNSSPKVTDSKVVVNGTITFVKGVKIDDLKSEALSMGRSRNLGQQEFRNMASNERRFRTLSQRMDLVQAKMGHVIWRDREQTVNGNFFFTSIIYQNPNLQMKNLQVSRLSSVIIGDYLENIVFLNQPHHLSAIVTENVRALDLKATTINGRLMAYYALTNPSELQVFSGRNQFLADLLVTNVIKVRDNFAGLSFSQPTFLLAQGNQTFPGLTMELSHSTVKNLYTRQLNDKAVFDYFADAVSLSGGVIRADKSFKNLRIKSAQADSVNAVNVAFLFDNAIYTDDRSTQFFTGPTFIESMSIGELNPENPNINEAFNLSSRFINIEGGAYGLKSLTVTRATHVDVFSVSRQINNIQVIDRELDVFLVNSLKPQFLQSKTLPSVKFFKHVEANELVDGIQLSGWSEILDIELDEKDVIQEPISLKGSIQFKDSLIVTNEFRQGSNDILNTLRWIASTDDVMLPGSCDLQFENLEIMRNSDILGHVNEVRPAEWVVNSESEEVTVTAEKTFTDSVSLNRNIGAKALFGPGERKENILEVLPTILLDGVEQTFTHPLVFTGSIQVSKASCPNTILNGIPFENLLFKKGDQTVHIKSIFRNSIVATDGVFVSEDINAEVINGIKFKDQLSDTLRTGKVDEAQVVLAEYSFSELSTNDADVEGSFDSSDVETTLGNIVLKNQNVIAKLKANQLVFNAPVTIGRLEYLGRMNGILSSDWGHAWLLKHGDQTVNTKVAFSGPLTVNMAEMPTVNKVAIQQLSSDIIRLDSDDVLEGSLTFTSGVKAKSGIMLPDGVKVNEIDLRRDVLLKSSPQVQSIHGNKNFMDGIAILGNLFVKEIPSFDIANFASLLSSDKNSITEQLSSLLINGELRLANEPGFESSFNELDWDEIMENFWLRDKDALLQQPVQFSTLVLSQGGSMDVSARLNGVKLAEFESGYASKSRDQEWTGNVILENVNQVNTLTTPAVLIDKGKFNGVDIKDFYDSVLRYSGDQNIHGTVKADNLGTARFDTAGGTINSHELRDFMTVSGPNELTSSKSFDKLLINTIHLSPETVIDGVEMGKWDEHAVRRTGSQSLRGPVQFGELETTDNIVVDGLVDGVKYDIHNIFTTDLDQEIFGNVVIQSQRGPTAAALTAPAGIFVEGNLNGIDVQDSISKLVFKNDQEGDPIVIRQETEFDAPVILNQVRTEALVQGHNVAEMIDRFSRAQDDLNRNRFNGRVQYENLLNIANRMLRVSEHRAIFLDHFVHTQTIQVPSTYVKVLRKLGYPAIAIGFKKSSQITTENWWSYSAPVDYYQLQIGNRIQLAGTVSDIAELQTGKDHLFAFAVNSDETNRPADTSLDVINSVGDFEINKSPEKKSKAFILKSVDVGTPNVRPAISQIIYSNGFNSLRSFSVMLRDGFAECVVATHQIVDESESPVQVFCLDDGGRLNSIQEIKIDSPTMTTALTVDNLTLLGMLSRSSGGQPEGLLEMWGNVGNTSVKFSKHHCLPVFNAVSIDSISNNEDRLAFLAVASGALRRSGYQGSVFVYRHSELTQQFEKMETIEVSHPKDVKFQWLQRSNEIIMYILSESITNNIQVYKYQGLSGWNLVHQFTSEGGETIEVTDFMLGGLYRAQLLVTNPTETNIYSAEFMGITTVVEESMEMMREESMAFRARLDIDNL